MQLHHQLPSILPVTYEMLTNLHGHTWSQCLSPRYQIWKDNQPRKGNDIWVWLLSPTVLTFFGFKFPQQCQMPQLVTDKLSFSVFSLYDWFQIHMCSLHTDNYIENPPASLTKKLIKMAINDGLCFQHNGEFTGVHACRRALVSVMQNIPIW